MATCNYCNEIVFEDNCGMGEINDECPCCGRVLIAKVEKPEQPEIGSSDANNS